MVADGDENDRREVRLTDQMNNNFENPPKMKNNFKSKNPPKMKNNLKSRNPPEMNNFQIKKSSRNEQQLSDQEILQK